MRRRGNDELILGLALALEHEHAARTGHPVERRLLNSTCTCCMWLRVVVDEMEARQYDAARRTLTWTDVDDEGQPGAARR